ncbi:MAG: DUF4382 domain-containing protein [archaeon]
MKQKNISSIKFILGISCFLFLFTACTVSTTTNTTVSEGRVVMTVTDALVKMGTITSVKMTVDSVEFHSDAKGWIEVATPHRTYDLVALNVNGYNALLADLSLSPQRFDQIRLKVSDVRVTDENGTHDAKMPSGTLRLNGEIVVLSGKTATASFDFITDESLHRAGNGKYVFAPVIQLESRTDANADTTISDNVRITGGQVQTSSRVGMDTLGNLVVGGTLPPFLNIDSNGKISGTEDKLKIN